MRMLVVLLGASWLAGAPVKATADEPVHCSIVSLIATPELFDGKRVIAEGIAVIGFEANAIYLSREAADHGSGVNAIGLDLPRDRDFAHLNLKWVLVEGTFRKDDHPGPNPRGYIVDIAHIFAIDAH